MRLAVTLSCIAPSLSGAMVEAIAREASPDSRGVRLRELFYPYYWFVCRATQKTLFGRSSFLISCLVDARNRESATSDSFDLALRTVPLADVLDRLLDEPGARSLASRLLARVRPLRERALVPSRRELVEESLIYKPYWVAQTDERRFLIDGITGAAHPLEVEALAASSLPENPGLRSRSSR